MDIKLALEKIQETISSTSGKTSEDFLISYSVISTILNRLDMFAENNFNSIVTYRENRERIIGGYEQACELDNGDKEKGILLALHGVTGLKMALKNNIIILHPYFIKQETKEWQLNKSCRILR